VPSCSRNDAHVGTTRPAPKAAEMRTVFVVYLALIVVGIAFYAVIGLVGQ
jgi:hypothetical protein